MKKNNIRLLLYSITATIMLISMESESKIDIQATLMQELDRQILQEYIDDFHEFLERRRGDMEKITSRWLNNFAGDFIIKQIGGKDVNPDEARNFLTRAFEPEIEKKVRETVKQLADDNDSIAYLQRILSDLDESSIRSRSTNALPGIMKNHKHPQHKNDAKPWNKEHVDDELFAKIVVCNFMVYHMVEKGVPVQSVRTQSAPAQLMHAQNNSVKKKRSTRRV